MATLSSKTYPKRRKRSQVNYNYEYFDYNSCTEGMSSDEEEEIDNIFLNKCVDDEISNNRSVMIHSKLMNVEDDIDFSSAPAPKKKKTTYTKREGEAKQGGLIIHSTSSVY